MNLKYVIMYGIISSLFLFHIFTATQLNFQNSSSEISWAEQLIIVAEIIVIVAIYEMILIIISVLIGYHEAINPSIGVESLFTNVFLGSLLFKLVILIVVSLTIMSTFQGDGDGNSADVSELVGNDMKFVYNILSECLFNAILASIISVSFPSKFANQDDNKKKNMSQNTPMLTSKMITNNKSNRFDESGNDRVELYVKSMIELGHDEEIARNHAKQYYNREK